MIKKIFKDKTYRVINIDDKIYFGKDSFKNRTSSYIIDAFDEDFFKNKKVLDLGCASGAVLFEIKDSIKIGVGVDVDLKKLNIGKQIAKDHKIENITFSEDRLERFLYKTSEFFDCIFLLNILHHVQNPYGILNIVAEISDDLICIEAPEKGFYDAYKRDLGKEIKFNKLDLQDIISFLEERNYSLLRSQKSENQESFDGADRSVCVFKKKRNVFHSQEEVIKTKNAIVVGPGTSGKTRFLHKVYNREIEYKAQDIIKNNVLNEEGTSLKYGKNVSNFTKKHPIIYMAPDYKSLRGYKPNIDAWIEVLQEKKATAIVCYIPLHILRDRIENRLKNKKGNVAKQHLDNYPFSYQNLFYKLEQNKIKYFTIQTSEGQ